MDRIIHNGKKVLFLGVFYDPTTVPALPGIWIWARHKNPDGTIAIEIIEKKIKSDWAKHTTSDNGVIVHRKEESVGDKKQFNFPIKSKDNTLMVVIKELLNSKYEEDLKVKMDYNKYANIIRQIQDGGDLSWKRCEIILDTLGYSIDLFVYPKKD